MKKFLSGQTEFATTCYGTILLSALFGAAIIFVTFFLPENKTTLQEINLTENIEEDVPQFFGKDSVLSKSSAQDLALVLYRNEYSKASVEWFFTNVTGKKDIAHAILTAAEKYDVPLSLAFSLAYVESRYNANARHTNKNKTIDRGLFQLNSSSFPHLSEDDFYNPNVSAKYGMSHLKFCLESAGNEISALAMYNAGTTKVRSNSTPHSTLNYIGQIMSCRETIDKLFDEKVLVFQDLEFMSGSVQIASAK